MNQKTLPLVILLANLSVLTACGGGGSDDGGTTTQPTVQPTAEPSTQTGVFLDSAVANISYTTETQSGVTNSEGEYLYEVGETVTFAIGGLALPSAPASAVITPLELAGSEDPQNNTVVNISRFLQTMDSDGNPDNGISISDDAATITTQVNFDLEIDAFASNSDVLDVIIAGGQDSVPSGLVSAEDAVAHLQGTLDTLAQSASIVGVWRLSERPEVAVGGSDAAIVTLLSNGSYYFIEANEINEGDDWEYGSYSYANGTLTFEAILDLNGNIGPAGAEFDITLNGDSFSFAGDPDEGEVGNYTFSRLSIAGSGIEGVWTVTDELESKILLMFASDGTYLAVQPYEADGDVGFEWGTYSASEGVVTVNIMKDIGGSLLADESNSASFSATVNGNVMNVTIENESVALQRL